MKQLKKIIKANRYIADKIQYPPDTGLVLGSGLSGFTALMNNKIAFPYKDIPGYPVSRVEGHPGNFVFGSIGNHNVAALQGRKHLYEGEGWESVTFGIRILEQLGCRNVILTCSAGGIDPEFKVGDLMIITDILDLQFAAPSPGLDTKLNKPALFHPELVKLALNTAKKMNFGIQKGTLVAVPGPMYETPAEIHFLRKIGMQAISMSIAAETQLAVNLNLNVLGLAFITNVHGKGIPNHQDVLKTAVEGGTVLSKFLTSVIKDLN
ncbi:purine-nucleoside phosphorylase [bacterium]|nr:purine-nucleoside phosphorylase [bacterium]